MASVTKLSEQRGQKIRERAHFIIETVQLVTFLVLRQYLFSCQWTTTRCLSEYSRIATFHFVHRSKAGAPIMIFILLSQLFLPWSMCREWYLRKMMLPRLKFGENMEFLRGLNYLVLSIKYSKLEKGNLCMFYEYFLARQNREFW